MFKKTFGATLIQIQRFQLESLQPLTQWFPASQHHNAPTWTPCTAHGDQQQWLCPCALTLLVIKEEKLCMTELSGRRWYEQMWHVQTERSCGIQPIIMWSRRNLKWKILATHDQPWFVESQHDQNSRIYTHNLPFSSTLEL